LGFLIATKGAVTRMWRSCQVQPSQKERAISTILLHKVGDIVATSVGIALNEW